MSSALHALLSRLRPPRVLVVGDVILDEYLRGDVKRISPEAPVPVLESTATECALGGAANVANNLVALGCEVAIVGAVGDDQPGEALASLLAARGVCTDGMITAPGRPTTHKLRVIAQGQQVLRIDRELAQPLSEEQAAQASGHIRHLMSLSDGVVCSDYSKGFLGGRVLQTALAASRDAGRLLIVDPKGRDYGRYKGAQVLTPNLRELQEATGVSVRGPADLDRGARTVLELTEAQSLLVTCGKDGMMLYDRHGVGERIAAQAREVYDVTGAGDTVIATLGMALFAGADVSPAARLANAAAGIVVGKLGTATVGRQELLDHLNGHDRQLEAKIVSRAALQEALGAARARGQRIVFTNGCFDLLHPGHLHYLQAAKALGDVLVVGLNTDASVRRLKGPRRPIMAEQDRAQLLAGLSCVDLVTFFAEPTPAAIVAEVKPDVLVKGGDYAPTEVVGRAFVEASGGRLELVPLLPGQSSSRVVDRILRAAGTASESER